MLQKMINEKVSKKDMASDGTVTATIDLMYPVNSLNAWICVVGRGYHLCQVRENVEFLLLEYGRKWLFNSCSREV